MATNTSGGNTRATANTVAAMQRSAASRQCDECGRKSAMVKFSEATTFGSVCRWCGYTREYERGTNSRVISDT